MRVNYNAGRMMKDELRRTKRSTPFALLTSSITLCTAAVAILGCGDGRPARVPVSGQVLIDGEPLAGGYIRFVPPDDRPSQGTIDDQGRFVLGCYEETDGAVLGKHKVAVIANQVIDEVTMKWLAPQRYADFSTSGLEVEITGPTNDVLIELTNKAEQTP